MSLDLAMQALTAHPDNPDHWLGYLENRTHTIERFPSGTIPKDFFCLSAIGCYRRDVVPQI